MSLSMIDPQLICTHEAGHAVAHYSYGHPVQYIEVQADRGHVRPEPLVDPTSWHKETDERAEQDIVATLAGPIATEMLLARSCVEAERSDFDSIRDLCTQRGWDEANKLGILRPRARDLIREWEPSIRALAAELLKLGVGRLPARRMREVIEATSGRAPVPLDWGRHGSAGLGQLTRATW